MRQWSCSRAWSLSSCVVLSPTTFLGWLSAPTPLLVGDKGRGGLQDPVRACSSPCVCVLSIGRAQLFLLYKHHNRWTEKLPKKGKAFFLFFEQEIPHFYLHWALQILELALAILSHIW